MKSNVNPNRGVRKNNTSVFSEFDNNDEIVFINKNFKKTSNNSSMLITDPLHNKRLLMLPIISILFVVALVSSMSFAYYALKTNTINSSYVNTQMPSRVACNYNVTNNSFAQTVTLAQFGQSNTNSTIFSNTITSNISLNGVAGCQCTYSVYLYEDGGDRYVHSPGNTESEFRYQISSTVNSASLPNSTSGPTSANFDLCSNGSIAGGCRIGRGTIAVTTASTKVTHTYSFTTELYNTNYNQVSLTGKTYKYRVGVEVMNCNFLNLNDYLMRESLTSTVLGSNYTKDSIEEVYINNTNTVPSSGVVYSWDVSERQNGSIMAYLMNGSTTGKYKLYIGQEGGVRANPDSSYLFVNYTYLTNADLTNLITNDVIDMTSMFNIAGSDTTVTSFTLTGLAGWNTSKVKRMNAMFASAGSSATTFSIDDLSGWNVSNVINMNRMFRQAGRNATTWSIGNLSSWNVSNVTDMNQMFYDAGYWTTTWSIGNLNNWVVSKVTDMSYMFYEAGNRTTTWSIGNLSSWNVSNVTNMESMFRSAGSSTTTWSIGDISSWNVSKVTNMNGMFRDAGKSATTWSIGDISGWNVSNVTNMSFMFYNAGKSATTWSIGSLANWNVSNVTDMSNMFYGTGYSATTYSLNLTNWNVSKVTNMSAMVYEAGYNATTWSIGNLSSWDVSNVTNMSFLFQSTGYTATTWSIGNLSSWDVSKVTNMSAMFNHAGYSATTWSIGSLANWNVSSVTNMASMFSDAGHSSTTFSLNLSDWDVSNATDMLRMFYEAGYNATTWSIGDLSDWNVSNVTSMNRMFYGISYNTTSTVNLGTLHVYATNVAYMFQNAKNVKITLKVHNNPSPYNYMFTNAATASGSLITVDYTSIVSNINAMIATKSSTSNVVKGSLIS